MNSISGKTVCVLACVALSAIALCQAAPVEQAEGDDFTDEPSNEFDEGPSSARSTLQREPSELSGHNQQTDFAALQGEQYPVSPAASSATFGANHPLGENYMNTDDDSDADEGESSEIESSTWKQAMPRTGASLGGGRGLGSGRDLGTNLGAEQEAELRQWSQDDNGRGGGENGDADSDAQDSNIANAKIEMTPNEMATAAGHHHHHGHSVHGWLEMGAKTGKKGAFKWHDKHPVGGKGRR